MQKRHVDKQLYFEELARTTRKYTLPYLARFRTIDRETRILEIGCGAGGNLLPFVERGCVVTGIDLSCSTIEEARKIFRERGFESVKLLGADVFSITDLGAKFDGVIVRDVIEHVVDKEALLRHLQRYFLAPGGFIYVTFPAWQMPFGGHQQICRHRIPATLPFAHLLPRGLYKAYLKLWGEDEDTIAELLSIKRCAMSIGPFKCLLKRTGLRIVREQLYLINPHYEVKFGLRPRVLASFLGRVPFVRNFLSTSCTFILQQASLPQ